ncbi:MAG: Enoyl-CoA hydratase/carnithine racemase [Acidobacteria bacterium]|jgi:cyclohexa-1,5-dienecarbonyl-CoA hydratase|nr:Enoyl-CoA hydratase/carnithine racemase [Acidobacteriota bacterium]
MNDSAMASLNVAGDQIRLTLRRPPLNFLNLDMLRQIQELLESLGESPRGRILVIDSDCAAFSAGLEVTELAKEAVFLLLDQYHSVARSLAAFPRPTVALVRGVALGAGNELAACCDFVLASPQATFGQPEIKVGIMPSLAPLLLAPRIGLQRMLHMVLTGSPVDAAEAARIGLVYRTVAENAMDSALEEVSNSFRGLSLSVLELTLRAARVARIREFDDHLREVQSLYLNELMDLEDPAEGIKAFLEKRPPRWKHR